MQEIEDRECIHLEGHHVVQNNKTGPVLNEGLWKRGVFSFGRQIVGTKSKFTVFCGSFDKELLNGLGTWTSYINSESEKYEALWERGTLMGPGRYTSNGTLMDALWHKNSIVQFIQTYPGGCSCGDESVVDDGSQYQGERHGYGSQVINSTNKQYMWHGEIFKWWTKGIESSQPSRVAEAAAEMAQKRANQASITEAEIRNSLPLLVNKVVSGVKEIEEDSGAIAMKALKSHGSSLLKRKHEDCEVTLERVSLKCPISQTLMRVPVRGIRCFSTHKQCFDMNAWINVNCHYCPICSSFILSPQELMIDLVVQELLQNHNSFDSDIVDYPTTTEQNLIVPKFEQNDFTMFENLDPEKKKKKLECNSFDDASSFPKKSTSNHTHSFQKSFIEQFFASYEEAKSSLLHFIQAENIGKMAKSDITFAVDIRLSVNCNNSGEIGIQSNTSVSVERASNTILKLGQNEE